MFNISFNTKHCIVHDSEIKLTACNCEIIGPKLQIEFILINTSILSAF